MRSRTAGGRHLALPALIAVVLSAGACAHVNQDNLDAQLESLRADLARQSQEGDDAVRAELGARLDGVDRDVAALRADLQSLRSDFDMRIQEMEAAIRFDLPVYFQFDDATIQPQGRVVLDRLEQVIARHYAGAQLTVEGFTDPAGSVEYNLQLGERRAEAVKAALVDGGLPAEMIRTVSYGEDVRRLIEPEGKGPGTTGWQNRRVVVVVDHDGQSPTAIASREDGGR